MDAVFTYSLYGVAVVLLGISFLKDWKKTALSLKRAWKMFENVLLQFMAILLLVELLLAIVTPETIQYVIGAESGFVGMLITSLLSAIALVTVATELLQNGAGITQIEVFISTLTMVGFVTLPMKIKYLGKKAAIFCNVLAFLFALRQSILWGR